MRKRDPFKYFKTSPDINRLTVMLYVRFPLSLQNVEDLLQGVSSKTRSNGTWARSRSGSSSSRA
jgi:transposase-like protein